MYRLRLVRKSLSGTQSGRKEKAVYVYAAKNKILKFSYTALQEVFLPILQNRLFRITVWFSELVSTRIGLLNTTTPKHSRDSQPCEASKYVQSRIGSTYQQAKDFLEAGRLVLFSGTPCQIRGLKLFLAKEYENLLTVDLVCHGVPSPEIWRQYLHEIIATGGGRHTNSELRTTSQITGINFRDKTTGWQSYSLRFTLRRETGFGLPETGRHIQNTL